MTVVPVYTYGGAMFNGTYCGAAIRISPTVKMQTSVIFDAIQRPSTRAKLHQ